MKFLKDNTVVDIREALPKDALELLEYFKQVGEESTYLIMDHSGLNLSVEEEEEYLKKANENVTTKYFIAISKGKIIGEVALKGHDSNKTKHNADLGITVLKEYWHKGLGSILIDYAVNYARITTVIKNIYLEVRADNENAINLYKKHGFVQVGIMPDKIFLDGKYLDELVLLLQISKN